VRVRSSPSLSSPVTWEKVAHAKKPGNGDASSNFGGSRTVTVEGGLGAPWAEVCRMPIRVYQPFIAGSADEKMFSFNELEEAEDLTLRDERIVRMYMASFVACQIGLASC
jgi:hypothetical protein